MKPSPPGGGRKWEEVGGSGRRWGELVEAGSCWVSAQEGRKEGRKEDDIQLLAPPLSPAP